MVNLDKWEFDEAIDSSYEDGYTDGALAMKTQIMNELLARGVILNRDEEFVDIPGIPEEKYLYISLHADMPTTGDMWGGLDWNFVPDTTRYTR